MAVYACTDLHGHLNLYKQIKKFIKDTDTVFFLGDAGDRGPHPWETIKEIYKDKQFIYLKGNHEDMLVNAAKELSQDYFGDDCMLLAYNGGGETLQQWSLEEFRSEWISALSNLPLRAEYVNKDGIRFLMSHAGFTPTNNVIAPLPHDLLWDRLHFYDGWIDCPDNTIILHGHTPADKIYRELIKVQEFYDKEQENIAPWEKGAYHYCNGKKICLDNRTILTKQVTLFNLDTYEEHIFELGE